MSKNESTKTAIADFFRDGGNRLVYLSSGKMVLRVVIGLSLIAIVTSAARFGSSRLMRQLHTVADANTTEVPTAPPSTCEIPTTGVIKLSKCSGKPNESVIIGGPKGTGDCKTSGAANVYVDLSSINVGPITINAGSSLTVYDRSAQLPISLQTDGIEVLGTLAIGSPTCPIGTINPATTVTVTFKGNKPACAAKGDCPGYTKGIEVEANGALQLYGAKGASTNGGVNWTELASAAGPSTYSAAANVKAPATSATSITVADDVIANATNADPVKKGSSWQINDWIAVAGTGYSPFETEFVQIASFGALTSNGRVINLTQPLKFYHFGSLPPTPSQRCPVNNVPTYFKCGTAPSECTSACISQPSPFNFSDPQAQNYGVDERAEVGLISRNIKFTADTPATGESNHWGGELKFIKDFTEVSVQGVELQKFGKDQLGSYPFHFHMDGDLTNAKVLVDSNSVDHSYNKCVTVHMTQNLTISNNVCARIIGHIFYQEIGDEDNITFNNNLGLGAMSNSFDVNDSYDAANKSGYKRTDLIEKYWWVGDNLVDPLNKDPKKLAYDGFHVPDTDNQGVGTTGSCFQFGNKDTGDNGSFILAKAQPPCDKGKGELYIEPASGFWIINPSIKLHGNSIGGCQGEGKGYWYVPPIRGSFQNKAFIPIGTYPNVGQTHGEFVNNRVHGCDSGLYAGDSQNIQAGAPFPYQNASQYVDPDARPPVPNHVIMNEVTGVTATRLRNRGIWARPSFFTVKDARLATSRDDISLVTSGGPDGNYPGIYSLVQDSVVVGISQNNVDRWGPCPDLRLIIGFSGAGGWTFGCIDKTAAKKGSVGTGGDLTGNGYPGNNWNFAGYMIYDGPALIFHDHFVNFLADPTPLLTTTDVKYLNTPPPPTPPPTNGPYEGDAALGWFQGNLSSYPVATASEELSWDNVDFRHQVYTDQVNISSFQDGDKNTAIIDLDGTLSGYAAQTIATSSCLGAGNPAPCCTGMAAGSCDSISGKVHPISLNNLELNASGGDPGGSVDECQATGRQDILKEGRATANFAPGEVGALEFQALFPITRKPSDCKFTDTEDTCRHEQTLTFTKDSTEFSGMLLQHPKFALAGRDGQGVWEPKVQSGYGYTVTAGAGIPNVVHVAVVDTVKPDISTNSPFYVRVGICYQGSGSNAVNGHPKAGSFAVTQGYRSWGGGGVLASDAQLRLAYNQIDGASNGLNSKEACFNLDRQNFVKDKNCPAQGVFPKLNGVCPSGSTEDPTRSLCFYPKTTLTPADTLNDLTSNGKPVLNKYFYDATTGWLFLNVAQTRPNAVGASPLGACTGNTMTDPFFCPSQNGGESYYVCPAEGCWDYGIVLDDSTWQPAASACPDPYATYGTPPTPPLDGKLVVAADSSQVTRMVDGGLNSNFPHYISLNPPASCAVPSAASTPNP
jgi:hypothetical protein